MSGTGGSVITWKRKKFQLYVNNCSLLHQLNEVSSAKSKMRWALLLADFYFDIYHVPGTSSQAAECVSMILPVKQNQTNHCLRETSTYKKFIH